MDAAKVSLNTAMKNLQTCETVQDMAGPADCGQCGQPVTGKFFSTAGRVYHGACLRCSKCNCDLIRSGGAFFGAHGTEPLCYEHHRDTIKVVCVECKQLVTSKCIQVNGATFHPACFACVQCEKPLFNIPHAIRPTDQKRCCEPCWHSSFGVGCSTCHLPVMPDSQGDTQYIKVSGDTKAYHTKCFVCQDCGHQLSNGGEYAACLVAQKLYCPVDGERRAAGTRFK